MTDPKDQDAAPSDDAEPTPNDVSSSSDADAATTEESPTAAVDSTKSNDEAESPGDDSASAEDESDGGEESGDESATDEDDLPEWEPLSPEIVEDEAIRGDFMLRWAVILLAFLLGCRHITDTVTLVRIRTGEHLASNGILPPANDVFSYTASERPWVNLGWLFDL
ncbi:MAG: hypothetical protein ACI8P0_000535, partial [Planctomycetaceae bacterium]